MGTILQAPKDPVVASCPLVERFGITEHNLAARREFIGLGKADQTVLADFAEWAQAVSAAVAGDLLEHQLAFPPTRALLERLAGEKGQTLNTLRERLEAAQAKEFEAAFMGAAGNWGSDYFEGRLLAGWANADLHLPAKWHIGCYPQLLRISRVHLKRSRISEARATKMLDSLNKVFNLNIQAIADSFLMHTLDLCGLDIEAISAGPGSDGTDHFDQVQEAMSMVIKQSNALAEDKLRDTVPESQLKLAGKLGDAFHRANRRFAKLAEQADLLACGDLQHPSLAGLDDMDSCRVLGSAMRGLYRSLEQITQLAADISSGKLAIQLEQRSENDELVAACNLMIFTIQKLMSDLNHMSAEHNLGDTDVRIPVKDFEGAYREVAESINKMVESHLQVNQLAMACVGEFGRGNFAAPLPELPGKKRFINEVIETVRGNLKLLIADTNQLVQAAASKNLRVRVDASRHPGDYQKIIEAINTTLDSVIEPLRITADNAVSLAKSAEQLTASSNQMVTGAEETARQASTVSHSSEQISENVTSMAASSEQMLASIREISRNANEAACVAKSAVDLATGANTTIAQLGESSRQIGKVVKVITSIARQTNLLALNATIEAARAGDAGKGFAVVANEVKELSKETARATEEISNRIEAIQADTQSAIRAIGEVTGIIGAINDVSNSIASAVEEQTATTNEIGRNVHDAARGTSDISHHIGSVARVAFQTAEGANVAQRAAQALTILSIRMKDLAAEYRF